MADIFDEVGDELRADRARTILLRYGFVMVLAAVAVIVAVAGWQGWEWYQTRRANAAASVYFEGMQLAGGDPAEPIKAAEAFQRLTKDGTASYRVLARLRLAALKADAGDLPAALTLWDDIAQDSSAPPLLRGLANLLWVRRQLDQGDAKVLEARLTPLQDMDNPWHGLALEVGALLDIRTGKTDHAKETLRRLLVDGNIAEGIRGRANLLLAGMGE